MSFATYKTAIKTWIEAQSGLKAQWRDEQGGWQAKTRIRMHLFGDESVGRGWASYVQDEELDPGEDLVPSYHVDGALTLSIVCTSRDQEGASIAMHYLRLLRTSLRKPSVRAALRTAGLAESSCEQIQDLTSLVDDRVESVAQLDVHFNAVVNEEDADEAQGFVETVETTAVLTTPGGEDVGWDEN